MRAGGGAWVFSVGLGGFGAAFCAAAVSGHVFQKQVGPEFGLGDFPARRLFNLDGPLGGQALHVHPLLHILLFYIAAACLRQGSLVTANFDGFLD